MHYYKFNIPSWVQATAHLLPEELGVYLKLINRYYDTEKPIPEDIRPVLRKLQLLSFEAEVTAILNEFFVLTDKGWINKKCSAEIKKYHQNSKINKANGIKGGRPPKTKAVSVTEKKPDGLLTGSNPLTETKGNHKPLTTNQEPLTINHKPRTINQEPKTILKEKPLVELKHDDSLEIFKFWQNTLNHPKAAFDAKRKALIRKQLKSYSVDDLKSAIYGCSVTPHNMGDNDRGEVYDSIELILREAKQIDRFMKNATNPPTGKIKTIGQAVSESQAQADRVKQVMRFDK